MEGDGAPVGVADVGDAPVGAPAGADGVEVSELSSGATVDVRADRAAGVGANTALGAGGAPSVAAVGSACA